MRTHTIAYRTALVAGLITASPWIWAVDAGTANFVFGDVTVRSTNGSQVTLKKGGAVQSGDDILTSTGAQAQIRFSDGGMVAIQPNSQFKLASYADRNDAKTDSFLVELAKGGMRAITGLIGKRNHDNYKVITNTATIGIRGSSFLISYNNDGSVAVNAEQDAIVVCTNTGCAGLTAGETVVVKDKNQDPARTTQRTSSEGSVPPPPQSQTVAGNKVYIVNDLQAEFKGVDSAMSTASYSTENTDGKAAAIIVDTPLVAFADTDSATHVLKGRDVSSFNSSGDPFASDYIGWGYWAGATKTASGNTGNLQDVHYVVGRPTPTLQMPTVGTFDYNLIGGTAPTATNTSTGTTQVGQLVGATLTVDFGSSQVQSISATTRFAGTNYTASSSYININGARFSDSNFSGLFSGAGAAKAAFTYQKTGTTVGTITGAVGMTKGAENTSYMAQ
jgi:hypothetical protein